MKKILCFLLIMLFSIHFPAFADVPDVSEGDILLFGRYEQDGDPDNGPEPLQWLVLQADDDSLLLITQYEIAFRKYCEEKDAAVSWADSDIRAWLNTSFLTYAFTEAEYAAILETTLHTPGQSETVTHWGKSFELTVPECDTVDRAFILSSEEILNNFFFGQINDWYYKENWASMPVYGLLLKLAMNGDTYYEDFDDIPDVDEYYENMTGSLLPLAKQADGSWELSIPSVPQYAKFWKQENDESLLQPWMVREQGKCCFTSSDGSGDINWYQWYCWDPVCVRPALRISRSALEQNLAVKPTIVIPFPSDPNLTGVWKVTMDGITEYYRFAENDYHMWIGANIFGDLEIYAPRFEADSQRGRILVAMAAYSGEIIEIRYSAQENSLLLKTDEQEIVFERAEESEFPHAIITEE